MTHQGGDDGHPKGERPPHLHESHSSGDLHHHDRRTSSSTTTSRLNTTITSKALPKPYFNTSLSHDMAGSSSSAELPRPASAAPIVTPTAAATAATGTSSNDASALHNITTNIPSASQNQRRHFSDARPSDNGNIDSPGPASGAQCPMSPNGTPPLGRPPPAAAATFSSSSRHTSYSHQPPPQRLRELTDPTALLRIQHGVVKGRSGSVLSRGFILKNDRLPPRNTRPLDFSLKGAPNFRPAGGNNNIYGSAQPSVTGLRTVLSALGCQPNGPGKVVWICTREEPVIYIGGSPFVLRDAEDPLRGYALSDRPEALESIERRLKNDILREAQRYGGLVQVQEELASHHNNANNRNGGEPQISAQWIAASSANVMTIRELCQTLREEGFNVEYHRIAISSDENPENQYLDHFLDVVRNVDPQIALYFNDGVGVVRATFAMTMALLVRRHKASLVAATSSSSQDNGQQRTHTKRTSVVDQNLQKHLLAESDAITKRNRSLIRLTAVLNNCISPDSQTSLMNALLSQPQVLENLRMSIEGDYDVILNLLSCLDTGAASKALTDAAIDQCDSVINLREDILNHRINLAMAAMDESNRELHLSKAVAGLERYFFLVAFANYLGESENAPDVKYSSWLEGRAELRNMVTRMRKPQNSTWIFGPVADLSGFSKRAQLGAATPLAQSRFTDVMREGGEVIADEFAAQIVRRRRGITLRAGMILKKDIWRDAVEDPSPTKSIRGTLNFRRIPQTDIYALSQPTESGITGVLDEVAKGKQSTQDQVTWVNLREEPLVYINGAPYVLREESLSLRNLKSYAGISASRLELIEDRLKRDILAEISSGDGRILLHSERADGTIMTVWESVEPEDVVTIRELMEHIMTKRRFTFRRIPITAEGPPNFADVAELLEVVSLAPLGYSVVLNCQLGRGRSTLVSIMLVLFRRWLQGGGKARVFAEAPSNPPKVLAYAVINNLIRVIRNGREIKMHVDSAIQECSAIFNLLESIEDAREAAEEAEDEQTKKAKTRRGLDDLRRYFMLILLAAWLNESSGEDLQSLKEDQAFGRFVKDRPVFQTIHKEIDAAGEAALVPLDKSHLSEGVASDEVQDVVAKRNGRILSASTILKSDFFSNLQKLSLPERIEGAPNYRRASMYIELTDGPDEHERSIKSIFGTGMPTVEGLRRALEKMGASKGGSAWVFWTLMREEPVIFVRGRPHVLRLLNMPLENVITTGVTAESVEGQESALKTDVIREAEKNEGRLLLHDETDDGNGKFTITAQWEEDITPQDILTPADVYKQMYDQGYKVDYARLPVTDEQAPIPGVFAKLEERVEAALHHSEVSMAFNCQMGRGRTTTAMVAATLVATVLHAHDSHTPSIELSPAPIEDDTFAIRNIQDPYQQGEYKNILQLLSVLPYGKLAKQVADRAIDQCEAVQNLRNAVATYKLQWESAPRGSSKQQKVGHIAHNYLFRYGMLIAFANYLLEKKDSIQGTLSSSFSNITVDGPGATDDFPSFPDYLTRRPEIQSVLKRKSLD